jgi:hypothetical protein
VAGGPTHPTSATRIKLRGPMCLRSLRVRCRPGSRVR